MALKYNKITVIGKATRDAEMTYTQTGTAMTKLGVAYNHSVKNQQGGWDNEPTFFNVVTYNDLAERSAGIKKGDQVLVEGRMRQNSWKDNQGTKHERWEIIASVLRADASHAQDASQYPAGVSLQEDPDDLPF